MARKRREVPEGWHRGGTKVVYNELASHRFVSVVLKGDLASIMITKAPPNMPGMWHVIWVVTHNFAEHSEGEAWMTTKQVEEAFDDQGIVIRGESFKRVGSYLSFPGFGTGISIFVTKDIGKRVRSLIHAFRTIPSEVS